MPELRVDGLIFDMDGVVIDSGHVYADHWRRWGARHGLDYDRHIRHVHPGRPPVETIRAVAPELDAAAEAAIFDAGLAEGAHPVGAMPGALDLLRGLPAGRWAIATSAVGEMARTWLRLVGLPVPAVLVSVEDVEHGKPAPDPYLLAAERLGCQPARCLVVEDAPAGVTAAKAAGATVLAVLTTHGQADLRAADHHAAGLHALRVGLDGGRLLVRWEEPA